MASEAIHEGNILKTAFSTLLCTQLRLVGALTSRDLLTFLSTQRNSVDKSIQADIKVIRYEHKTRYEYETHNVDEIVWMPGQTSLTDPASKNDSLLSVALQLTLSCGKIGIEISQHVRQSAIRPLG